MRRRSQIRTQENVIDTGASGIRWFKLTEPLAEYGTADAYPCKWSPTQSRWEAQQNARKIPVYSTIAGITGEVNKIVPCYLSPWSRKYEVLVGPPGARNVVMWTGNTVLEGVTSSRWATNNDGYVKFLGRYGNADAGITFNASEAAPSTNGNFTVTQSGTYLFHLSFRFDLNAWSSGGTGYAEGNFQLRYKRGSDSFANTGISGGDWAAEPYVSNDVNHYDSDSGLFPLVAGDKLHIRLSGASHSSGDPKTFTLESFRMTYERVGDFVAVASP